MKDLIEYISHLWGIVLYHFDELQDELRGENFHDWKKMRDMPMHRITLSELTLMEKYPKMEDWIGFAIEPNELLSEVPWLASRIVRPAVKASPPPIALDIRPYGEGAIFEEQP